ncbi:MAG: response regulator [Chthoniobacterales bacterium]|nr:response regulator [Chthoniobacterales bacterium]
MVAESNAAEAAEEKVNILIVDDRSDKLLGYEVVLAELNQNLVRATSGTAALRCLLKQDFAVILLDVNMPGMDGFETAALIRQRGRSETTPIIFISAVNDTENHVSRGYSLGAVDYILTPVVPEILRAKIAVFVDLFKKTEQIKRQAEERTRFLQEQAARAEAELRQEQLGFLAEASNVLAGSLEYQDTFENLARLVVPRLADLCVIHLIDAKTGLREVAAAHDEASGDTGIAKAAELLSSSDAAKQVASRVVETAKSDMLCEFKSAALSTLFDRTEDQQVMRELGACSLIAVPIRARERVLGSITMINTTPLRPCGPNELSLVEELAQRAALALENAGLYTAAQQARTEAERANLAKDQFLAMLSHESRTPLTPVLNSVLALEHEEELSAEGRASLEMIRRNVELEARLIDDLLDLTRISKGKVQLNREIVDGHSLLRTALEICQADVDQKHLDLTLNLGARDVQLQADPARLQQIFWNLIKNAVKFTPKGGRVMITTGNDESGAFRVEIADSGMGIDADSLPKIFNAFEQGERTRLGGLGLGLAITKALVERHKGSISAESAGRNQGAKFTVVLPLSRQKSGGKMSTAAPSFDNRQSMRILLVEDHEDTNRSLTNLLRRRGYAVQSANNVQSALDLAATEQFDVLVSDIGLPDGSGIDLMQTLHATHPLIGIALTGFGMEDDIQRSQKVGFEHHLVKPVDLNRLDALIQTAAQTRGATALPSAP